MATDALMALIIGRLFDKKGLIILIIIPIMSIFIAPLSFSKHYYGALMGVIVWGAVMGIQDTVMRAAIANMIPVAKRGLAYGIFNTVNGAALFIGSTIMGIIYDSSILYVILFSIIFQLSSVPLLLNLLSELKKKTW